MTHQTIVVPDIGGAEGAEVVELLRDPREVRKRAIVPETVQKQLVGGHCAAQGIADAGCAIL